MALPFLELLQVSFALTDQQLVAALQGDESSLPQVFQQWSEGLVRTEILMSVIGKESIVMYAHVVTN